MLGFLIDSDFRDNLQEYLNYIVCYLYRLIIRIKMMKIYNRDSVLVGVKDEFELLNRRKTSKIETRTDLTNRNWNLEDFVIYSSYFYFKFFSYNL